MQSHVDEKIRFSWNVLVKNKLLKVFRVASGLGMVEQTKSAGC
jgi:hypothetical protein